VVGYDVPLVTKFGKDISHLIILYIYSVNSLEETYKISGVMSLNLYLNGIVFKKNGIKWVFSILVVEM
jgi:hypothetical protein